jgi:hypothetical protein
MAANRTLQTELLGAFERIQHRETFQSPPAVDLKKRFDEAIFSAAIAKCVDLNLLINSEKVEEGNSFLFLSNLRGVAEDLIVLQFLAKMSRTKRRRLLTLIQRQNLHSWNADAGKVL